MKGIAIYHGFQSNPKPYYANSDCVILPSYHEGMSNVLLEACATGRPVITSDIPGCREAVIADKNGYLCRVGNVSDIYDAMKKMLILSRDEREKMGIISRELMVTNFNKRDVIKQL